MHPNPTFRKADTARNLVFARDRGFGTLAVAAEAAPLLSHVPFLLSADGRSAEMHLVRSNPILHLLAHTRPATLAVTGPHGYISPDWYGLEDHVPTWNYIAVHLRGGLSRRPDTELRAHLDRLSAHFEAMLAPKPAWRTAKMTPDMLARMMRQVVPVRLDVETVDGTWKLGQNKPEEARLGAADEVARGRAGDDLDTLAALMRDPPA